ncbi:MAG TPA: hypothetical protein VMK16_14910 [Acidimicrobiales bacterium]|nr:hypothetical protein [Acidimicrobiales bacterium]
MSDQSLPPDEMASALLDGEIRPSDVAATVAARVDELRTVAEAVAAPVPVDELARERAIAAALAAFDDASVSTPMRAPARRSRFVPALVGAAAALIVAIGAVAALRHDDASTSDTATAAGSEASPTSTLAGRNLVVGGAGAATDQGVASGAAATPASPEAPAAAAPSLGEFVDANGLRSAIAGLSSATKATGPVTDSCEATARRGVTDLGSLTESIPIQWQGQAARALVFADTTSPSSHIVVVGDPTCEVLDRID